jgi:hypothetical protein
LICSAAVIWISKLNRIVFPPAHGTAEESPGWSFLEREATATRTRKGHLRLMLGHKEVL